MYGTGISRVGEIIDLAVKYDIINKSGAWFSYGETRLGQGRDNVKILLTKEKNLADEIDRKVRERFMQESKREQLKDKDEEKAMPSAMEAPKAPARRPGSVRAKIDILVDDDDE